MFKDYRAVALKVFDVFDATPRPPQKLEQHLLPLGKRLPAIVLAIEFEQIERKELHLVVMGAIPKLVEVMHGAAEAHGLAVDDDRRNLEPRDSFQDQWIAFCVVDSLAWFAAARRR